MRILRLDLGEGTGTIDLHPFVSILHDLQPTQRHALTSAIRSLVNGSGEGLQGLVENTGHLVELGSSSGAGLGPLTTEDIVVEIDRLSASGGDCSSLLAELDQLRRSAQIDAVYVEEIRADLEPAIAARVQRLRDQLSGLQRTPVDDSKELCRQLGALVVAAAAVDPTVREIPDHVRGLIADWDDYQLARRQAGPHIDGLNRGVQAAEAALGDAQRALQEARANAVPLSLSPEQEARLEELADTTLGRRGRRDKGLSVEEQSEMDALLALVDVPTFTAYAMYRLNPAPPADKLALVSQAEQRVVEAVASLEETRANYSVDEVATQLNLQFDALKTQARDHFGPMLPSDLGAALSELVVERDNPAHLEAIRDLYDACMAADIEVPETIEPAELTGWVTEWIRGKENDAKFVPVIDHDAVRQELAGAEKALDRHARAMGRIDRIEARAEESANQVIELERKIDRVERGDGATADTVLAALLPLTQRIEGQNGGSVPIVIDGDFADIDDDQLDALLNELEGIAQQHQLVVITNRRRAATWASGVGLRRALQTTASASAASGEAPFATE